MSEKGRKATTAGRGKVSKAKSVSVKPGIKSTPVKRSGCFKERQTKSGKKITKKIPRPKPGYSLYSSDSEDQISSLNCGIDKCSELLANLIQRKKGGNQWAKPVIMLSREGNENCDLVNSRCTPLTQTKDRVFIPTAGTESPDTQVANMVDGRLARSRAPLVEVRTPFNQRLVSSTPDPEKVADDDGYAQMIPEKDTHPSKHGKEKIITYTPSLPLPQQNIVQEVADLKIDNNQNYLKEGESFEKAFRPVSFHTENDFIEGVKRFEDSFPACHNRKSSIGDFQCYLQRESTGFSPPLFPSSQDKPITESVSNDPDPSEQPRQEEHGFLGNRLSATEEKVYPAPPVQPRVQDKGYTSSKEKQGPEKSPDPHNRDYLNHDYDTDQQEDFSAPLFNSSQVKMFGPGYRRRSSRDEQCDLDNSLEETQGPILNEAYQYNLSQKVDKKEMTARTGLTPRHTDRVQQLPHQLTGHASTEDRSVQEMQQPTVSSPVRTMPVEPRAILGRHTGKTPTSMELNSNKVEHFEQHAEPNEIFVNYERGQSDDQDVNWDAARQSDRCDPSYDMSNRLAHFNLNKDEAQEIDMRENYPSSLINPSTLNSNVCISKPVASQLPMLETPANSPVSLTPRNRARDLREATLRRMTRETAQGHDPHLYADNIRPRKGASDNLERRFQDEANHAPEIEEAERFENYELETAPFQSEQTDPQWTMTPVNSPAARICQEPKFINRAPSTPAPNQSQHQGPSALLGHTPAPQAIHPASQNQPTLPARLEAIAGPRKLRYLVKELGEVCKVGGESELQYVVEDIQECIEAIPQLKPTFNLQTEVDLLLQPLRSENSQLRRRLRIVNQQLKERERQEKENTNHGINFEMLHLQTDNASLHRQLKEEKELTHRLSQELERMKYERQRLIVVLGDKENDCTRTREESCKESQKLQFELELARKQTEGSHLRHAASESENRILQVSLKQRDLEITRLQDLVQTLKDGVGEVLRSLDNGGQANGASTIENSFSLQKMLLLLNKQGSGYSPAKSVMSDPGQPTVNKEAVASAKKNLKFDNNPVSSPRKSKVSPLSKEALHQHNKLLRKETPKTEDLVALEKGFQSYMSPFNSSPKSDRGSVTEMLLRNCSSRSREIRDPVKPSTGSGRQVMKLPQPNFDTSDSGLDTEGTPGASKPIIPSQVAPQDSSSLQSEAFKGTELDLSLSTIEEDVRSVVSAVTSTTSLSTVDDKAFREGIAALDANIAKVLNALEKTKKMFS
ncbi:uncharacterized protein LOC124149259 [Haliotis rufescens]|uniref:uncharacterized protein LOC124149259 n=1 Tax=Haliotis rufescens TaxID=6454 RepID=UPI00201F259D|nr:uncharacterized protein LOC124149259 [Haliotis rufescens]XP_046376678.2 uncharacterized protein LOC124149259 [Haliotis rufescens]